MGMWGLYLFQCPCNEALAAKTWISRCSPNVSKIIQRVLSVSLHPQYQNAHTHTHIKMALPRTSIQSMVQQLVLSTLSVVPVPHCHPGYNLQVSCCQSATIVLILFYIRSTNSFSPVSLITRVKCVISVQE